MNISIFYFSGTGNTEVIAKKIKETLIGLDNEVDEYDITDKSNRNLSFDFDDYDGVVFGFPVYAWRIPKITREWLSGLKGKGTKSATFFTYGGVSVGAAHYTTKEILSVRNFKLLTSAEFLARHTFNLGGWELMSAKPDEDDLKVAENFASMFNEKLLKDEITEIILEEPEVDSERLDKMEFMLSAVPIPFWDDDDCSLCKTCESICPTGAINAEKKKINGKQCIRCLKCVITCPDNKIKVKDMTKHQKVIKKVNNLTEEVLNNKKSKIIT